MIWENDWGNSSDETKYTPGATNISNGNPPFPIGNTSSNGGFSIAMLVY